MNRFVRLAVVAAIFAISGSLLADQWDRQDRDQDHHRKQACFYLQEDFQGPSWCYEPGQSSANLSGSILQDSIRSVEVFGRVDVLMCRDKKFKGGCITLDRSARSLGGFSGQASSFSITGNDKAGGDACFYTEPRFRGNEMCLEAGQSISNLNGTIFQDSISSIDMDRNINVTVCRDKKFKGGCVTFTDPARNLGAFDNTISSITVTGW